MYDGDDRLPTVPDMRSVIECLYNDGLVYYDPDELADRTRMADAGTAEQKLDELRGRFDPPFAVFDPRYVGYSFPSYTFVRTENNLENGAKANRSHFPDPETSMLLGTVLGDVDIVQRRADADRWANAEFAKWAKGRLDYFENFETYPVFQIARWHGKERTEPLETSPRPLRDVEAALVEHLRDDPELLALIDDDELTAESIPESLDQYTVTEIESTVRTLEADDILLGTSISYDIYNSPWNCAIMGLSLGAEDEAGGPQTPRMDLTVDHDHVIDELLDAETEYLNEFTMPFVTSGIGQGWADILLELRVDEPHHLDGIAEEIRTIDYVESTKTYFMTTTLFNEPLGLKI